MRCLIAVMGEHGHVNPALAIAKQLVSSGVTVAIFVPEPFRAAAMAVGAEVLSYTTIFAASRRRLNIPADHSLDFPTRVVDEGLHVMPQLLKATQTWAPDLIAYDKMLLAAGYVAARLKIPAAILSPTYAENEYFSVLQARGLSTEPSAAFSRSAAAFAAIWDTEPVLLSSIFHRAEALNLVFLPRIFQPYHQMFDQRYEFVGPCLDIMHKPLGTGTAAARPLIYVSLGTVFNAWPEFYQACSEAFRNIPAQVIMAIGDAAQTDVLGTLPSHIQVLKYAPQVEILRQANLFITHGGMNSAMEALYLGVPMIVIPQMPEQEVTACRIHDLRLGLALPKKNFTATALQQAVEFCLKKAVFTANVETMQHATQTAGGAPLAAKLLIDYAGTIGR